MIQKQEMTYNSNKQTKNIPISVVVPTCNRSDLIRRCAEALAQQTYTDFEAIIVNDGSKDDTVKVLDDVQKRYPNLKLTVFTNETNKGANPSRNRGVQAATGEIIAFLDDDSMAEPNWLENMVKVFDDSEVAAAVGFIKDPKPSNIWELTLKGTHIVGDKPGPARRLVGCNMALRRNLLIKHTLDEDYDFKGKKELAGNPDMSVSGRSDEEGIYLKLKAAGHKIMVQPSACVYHEHFHNRRSFFRQAYKGGRSAAKLVYKFKLNHRLDMLPFMLAYGSIPLAAIIPVFLPFPPLFFSAAIGAITYNDLCRKKKTPLETLTSFPTLLAYYHTRLYGYVRQTAALHLKSNTIKRIDLNKSTD